MIFSIKNLKFSEFASQETFCFEATLYKDGKRFCIASNDGHGGPNNYYPLKGGMQNDLWREITAINMELASCEVEVEGTESTVVKDLDMVVNDLVGEELIKRDVKKMLRKFHYYDPHRNSIFTIKGKHTVTPDLISKVKATSWWHESFVAMNELDFDVAVALYKLVGEK